MTVLKHDNVIMTKSRDLDDYFDIFERSYAVAHSCKVS